MDADEEQDDIKRLNDIIKAENLANNDDCHLGLLESDSSDSDDSETDDNDNSNILATSRPPADLIEFSEIEVAECTENLQVDNLDDITQLAPHLTFEEYDLIKKCEDSDLKRLLILNRTKKVQLRILNNKYYNMLNECNINLKFEYHNHNRTAEILYNSKSNNFAKVGRPYFRDTRLFSCLPNGDIQRKRKNREINTAYFPKRKVWNSKNQASLKSKVMLHYFKNVLKSMEDDLKKAKAEGVEVITHKIEKWRNNFDNMEPPALWNDKHINWEQIATQLLNDPLSSDACRALWNLHIHPSINKNPFSEEESMRILELIDLYGCQKWDGIAEKLDTNRSPYLLSKHYHRNLRPNTYSRETFTKEEDEYMLNLIESNIVGDKIPWSKIAYHFDHRSKMCLYSRYKYTMAKGSKKLGKFSESEDVLLMCLAKKYGEDFDRIALDMQHRTKTQLSMRYYDYLMRDPLALGNWTVEEDEKILEHVNKKGAGQWPLLKNKVNRPMCHIRHRYNVLKKYIDSNPDFTLEDLPRRSHLKKSGMTRVKRAHYSVEHYMQTNTLPKLEPFELKSGDNTATNRGRPTRLYIDSQLTDFFRSTAHIRKMRSWKSITMESMVKCAHSVQGILNILGVKLNLPSQEGIRRHMGLNDVDKEVLMIMCEQNSVQSGADNTLEIPPNINTIQALRCLLLKFRDFRDFSLKTYKVVPSQDKEVELHRQLFQDRFKALFRWPCLMSIMEPSMEALVEKKQVYKGLCEKRIGRPRKNLGKVEKMNVARLNKSHTFNKKLIATITVPRIQTLPVATVSAASERLNLIVQPANEAHRLVDTLVVKSKPVKTFLGPISKVQVRIKEEPKAIEDEEAVDDPDETVYLEPNISEQEECAVNNVNDCLASTSNIDLPTLPDPSKSLIKLPISAESSRLGDTINTFSQDGIGDITKLLSKKVIIKPPKYLVKLDMAQVAKLQKNKKLVVVKNIRAIKRVNGEPALVEVKKSKRQ